jgi:hypothetical protein
MLTRLRDPKVTIPGAMAKRVSSLARFTLRPGLKRVPHCLTIMAPVLTAWPP